MMNGCPPLAFTASTMPASSSTKPPMPRLPAVIAIRASCFRLLRNPDWMSRCCVSPRTSAMWSEGSSWATRASGGIGRRAKLVLDCACKSPPLVLNSGYGCRAVSKTHELNHLSNLVFGDSLDDVPTIPLAAQDCFAKPDRLFHGDVARHRRLVWIDNGLDDCWTIVLERLAQNGRRARGIFDRETTGAACSRVRREIDRLQLDSVFRIAFEHDLLPLDHAQRVVLKNDHLHGQVVLHECRDFAHQHREPAVANDADDLATGMRDRGADAVRQ